MLIENTSIEKDSIINDIVKQNYRTADVFRKYGIEYCCGGKQPLSAVCLVAGLEFGQLKKELETASRVIHLPPALVFENWDIDFLTNYIINVHHQYLKDTIPATGQILRHFADQHVKKYPYMQEVALLYDALQKDILPHIEYEENTIFPYIRQVAHAYENKDSYARLLVKTMRKPLADIMQYEEDVLSALIIKIRILTNHYIIPDNACVSHLLILSRLQELDNDLMQHVYLENEILFPGAIKTELELLT